MHKQNTTNEHQIETITKSPESIQDVAQPLRVTSIMPLVIILPGKLPNILYKNSIKLSNEHYLISISAINDKQKPAGSQGPPSIYPSWEIQVHRRRAYYAGGLNRLPVTLEPLPQFRYRMSWWKSSRPDFAISGPDQPLKKPTEK